MIRAAKRHRWRLPAALATLFVLLAAAPAGASAAADLTVTITAAPNPAVPTDPVVFTATATNVGTDPAYDAYLNFTVSDELDVQYPAGCQPFVIIICPIGSTDPDTGDRRLLPGASVQRQITLSKLQVGTVSVMANVTHEEVDPTPSNDSASASVTIDSPADLLIDMSAVSPVTVGNQTTVTATVTNTREGPARGAQLQFTVPPDLPVVAVPEGCTASALKVTCDLGIVGPQGKVARTITVQVPSEGSYIVIGSTSWAKPDPSPENAQTQVTITGNPPVEPTDNGPPLVPAEKPQLPTPQEVPISLITSGLPSGKKCLRSRTLRFKLRRPSGVSITQADLYFGSKRIKRLTGAALRKTIVMSRTPRASYKVIVVVSLRDGGRLRGRRALKTCR